MKINVVRPVRAVTIERFRIRRDGSRHSCGTKTYRTARSATKAWAQNIAFHFNLVRYYAGRQASDGISVNIIGGKAVITRSSYPIYDRAYRRALPIFKNILP